MKAYAEKILGDYQNGFRPGKSTITAIGTIERIIGKSLFEYNREMLNKLKVKCQGQATVEFNTNKGVKQGDPLSSILFSLVIGSILLKVHINGKNIIGEI